MFLKENEREQNSCPQRVFLQVFLKYVYTPDILIHQFIQNEFSYDSLQIF